MPSWEQHLYFILDGGQHPIYKSHKYTAWYIIPDMGAIYLTNMDEIGISLLPMYHGLGIADKAIKELIRLHPRKRYLANISPRNTRSIKFFDKHGFKHVQNTYELRAE
jgi:RimJ/RimL family protein N-acetyltransferase